MRIRCRSRVEIMQVLEPKISGTRDYVGEDTVALYKTRDAIEATLKRYGYAAIEPPILERSSPFLNRSGEDIRRRMYIFPDPVGREICLRPELTIPACRAFLRQLKSSNSGTHLIPRSPTNCCIAAISIRPRKRLSRLFSPQSACRLWFPPSPARDDSKVVHSLPTTNATGS